MKIFFAIILSLICTLSFPDQGQAKKKRKVSLDSPTTAVSRLDLLAPDEKRKFDALTNKQQQLIRDGKIAEGFNAWMVKLALGEPFYGTEHHPVFVDYEEVWLYTKAEIKQTVSENRFFDQETSWPSLRRVTTTKTCQVGDFFVLWDRGVVVKTSPAETKAQGKCIIETTEAILPIVDGKAVEIKK